MNPPNKGLWNSVCITDPKAVKPITGKQYQGNSPKPYWLIERATEEFGPVGVGWGVVVKSERFERLSETDVLHVAVVSVWYMRNGQRSESFDQMGGTKAAYLTSSGKMMIDEDAGKKSVTDGMVKCLSMIGFAGDIFSGRWDDSKYVASAREHYANKGNGEDLPKRNGVMADVLKNLPELNSDEKLYFDELAVNAEDLFRLKGVGTAYDRIQSEELDSEQFMHLWSRLDSKLRAAFKVEKGLRNGAG